MDKKQIAKNQDFMTQLEVIKEYKISREKLYEMEKKKAIKRYQQVWVSQRIVFYDKKEIEREATYWRVIVEWSREQVELTPLGFVLRCFVCFVSICLFSRLYYSSFILCQFA